MAPVLDFSMPSPQVFLSGIMHMSAVAFTAPESSAPWHMTIVNTLQRWLEAIGKAFSSVDFTHLKAIVTTYWVHIKTFVATSCVQIKTFVAAHPKPCIAVAVVLLIIAAVILLQAVLLAVLSIIGFTASGIVLGSAAAAYQTTVFGGYIVAGSLFALAQSVAAGGTIIALVSWPVILLAVILLAIGITVLVLTR